MTMMTVPGLSAAEHEVMQAAAGAFLRSQGTGEGTRGGQVAWVLGEDIHVAAGVWPPGTPWGRRVLGHEVAHVVQQRAGRVGRGADRRALEAEAHAAGERFALSLPVRLPGGEGGPLAVPTPAVQCWTSVTSAARAGANVVMGAHAWSNPSAAQDAFIGQDNVNLAAVPAPADPAVSFLNAAGNLNLVSADPANVTLRVSANGRLAIEDCVLTARQPKVFKDGSDVITLENYAHNTEAAPSAAARTQIGYYFQMYDTAPGAPLNHTFHGSWTGAAVRAVNPAVAADAAVPPGTTRRPVPNGVKTFVNPLTVRAGLGGMGYLGQLPGSLANLTDDQLKDAFADAYAGTTALVQLTTVLKGLLYAQRLADKGKPVKLALVAPWRTLLHVLNDPLTGTDRRMRALVAHTMAAFDALPTV